jgi:hypothetical protein
MKRYRVAAAARPLNAMRNAANKHWRAAAWLLERTNAQRFAKQNVRNVKPEHLQQFTEMIGNILQHEVPDRNARRRIRRRLAKLTKQSEAEFLAAELDPCPTRRKHP